MADWSEKTFKTRADLMLKLMNMRWKWTERHVDGMIEILKTEGKDGGTVLDLRCGNGRISTHFAMKGYKATGVDYSPTFIDDAKAKAREHKVSDKTVFIQGDTGELDKLLGEQRYDVVVNAWTSIGYTTWEDDVSMFEQARKHAKQDATLFIIDTAHMAKQSRSTRHTSFVDLGDMIMLEEGVYNSLDSRLSNTWRFYNKKGEDLLFEDQCEYDIRIYSLSEVNQLLQEAGWRIEATYGDIALRQPVSPNTGMNIVAKLR